MDRYEDDDVTFQPPSGWENGVVVAFTAPAARRKGPMNVVFVREAMRPGDTLSTHAERQLMALAVREDFEVIESRSRVVGGRPASQVHFSWTSPQGKVEQILVHVAAEESDPRTALCFTGTVGHAPGATAELQAALDSVLSSVRFPRARVSDVAPVSSSSSRRVSLLSPRAPFWDMPEIPMPGKRGAREP